MADLWSLVLNTAVSVGFPKQHRVRLWNGYVYTQSDSNLNDGSIGLKILPVYNSART